MKTEEAIKMLREKLRDDPVKFAYVMCGKKLTEYQKKIIEDKSEKIIVCASRQCGKSFVTSIKALWRAWCNSNQDIMLIAPTERQAEIIYSNIYEFVINNPVLYRTAVKLTQRKMEFDNGSVIRCLPAGHTGEGIRGYTCDMVVVDEAQSVPDEVFVSVIPSLLVKRGQLILLGTPSFGKQGFFWTAWISDGWSKHRITVFDNPFVDKKDVEAFKKMKGEVAYRREFLAEFVEADDSFFNLESVYAVATLTRKASPVDGYVYYCGVDWARKGASQNAVVIVGVNDEGIIEMHNFWYRTGRSMTEILNWVMGIIEKWKPKIVVADATSGWAGVVDRLKEMVSSSGVGSTVQEFNFGRHAVRREAFWNVKRLIEDKRLFLINDEKLLSQFDNFRVSYTVDGRELIKKEETNTDLVDALVMACWGIGEQGMEWKVADFINIDAFPRGVFGAPYFLKL